MIFVFGNSYYNQKKMLFRKHNKITAQIYFYYTCIITFFLLSDNYYGIKVVVYTKFNKGQKQSPKFFFWGDNFFH